MSGIWERVKPSDGADDDRINTHLMETVFILRALGEFTDLELLNGINEQLQTELSSAEIADMVAIGAAMNAKANTTAKLVYMQKIKAATIAGEIGSIGETKFRSILGI
jgi:hypothetical protein